MAVALHHPVWARTVRATPADDRRAVTTVIAVRRVRLRSVVRFAFVFLTGAAAVGLAAGLAAWHLAVRWGFIAHIENLMLDLGFETFEVEGDRVRTVVLLVAGAAILTGTLVAVVAAALFNLVNRVTGGIQLTTTERRTLKARALRKG